MRKYLFEKLGTLFEKLGAKGILNLERDYRLVNYFLGKPQPPFKLVLTPTDRCNLNCIFCPNYVARQEGRFKRKDELEPEEWIDIVKQAVELGVRQWCVLGGGEPLLRSEIILPILDVIKKRHHIIDFEIITNGTLLTDEILKGLVDICKEKIDNGVENALIQLTISVHGFQTTYKKITGYDMYEKVVSNLKKLQELKKKAGLKYPIVQINTVLNKINIKELPDFLEVFSNKLGVEQIAIHGLRAYPETREVVKNIVPDIKDAKAVVDIVNKMKDKLKANISLLPLTSHLIQIDKNENGEEKKEEPKEFNFLNYRCFEPWYDVMINPDGRVARCAAFTTRREPINIREQTLKEIWYGQFFNQVRENIIKGKLMEGCTPCGLMSNTMVVRESLKMFIERYLENDLNNLEKIKPFLDELIEKFFNIHKK